MPNGAKSTYSYTALGELDVLQNRAADNSNISRYDYSYDARGVRTQLQETIEADPVKTLMFSYDPANQLTGEQVTGGTTGAAYTASYQYDSAGNRTRFEKSQGSDNTVTQSGNNAVNQTRTSSSVQNGGAASATGYSYDWSGNLSQVNSANGSSSYLFDDASRLTQIVNRDAAGAAVSKSEFVYDGMSRLRTSKEFDWENGAWVSRGEKRRIYDGMNAVQERDGNGTLLATYTRGADMGGGIGGLLCRTFDGGKSFMHYDGRGNVVQLSDAAGAVSGKYVYDAFGNTVSQSGGAAGLNPYRFSTKEHIAGLVYYGYRFYSPGMGKWINRDPIEERGGVNLYNFVQNEPISNIDPVGFQSAQCQQDRNLCLAAATRALLLCTAGLAGGPGSSIVAMAVGCAIGAYFGIKTGIVTAVQGCMIGVAASLIWEVIVLVRTYLNCYAPYNAAKKKCLDDYNNCSNDPLVD